MEGLALSSRKPFELERLIFFSDAVFAIAITLLVVDIRLPADVSDRDVTNALLEMWPRMAALILTFGVIGTFWMSHHRMFRYIDDWDNRLIVWNILLLFFVAIQPATTALLGQHGNLPLPTAVYAVGLAGAGLTSTGLWLHAVRSGLVSPLLTRALSRYFTARVAVVPVLFVISIPLAMLNPLLAQILWVFTWPTLAMIRRRMANAEEPPGPLPKSGA
jgi:uncharacterized membrane protein